MIGGWSPGVRFQVIRGWSPGVRFQVIRGWSPGSGFRWSEDGHPGSGFRWSEIGHLIDIKTRLDQGQISRWRHLSCDNHWRFYLIWTDDLLKSLWTIWCIAALPSHLVHSGFTICKPCEFSWSAAAALTSHQDKISAAVLASPQDTMSYCFSLSIVITACLRVSRSLSGILVPSGAHGWFVFVTLPGPQRQCPHHRASRLSRAPQQESTTHRFLSLVSSLYEAPYFIVGSHFVHPHQESSICQQFIPPTVLHLQTWFPWSSSLLFFFHRYIFRRFCFLFLLGSAPSWEELEEASSGYSCRWNYRWPWHWPGNERAAQCWPHSMSWEGSCTYCEYFNSASHLHEASCTENYELETLKNALKSWIALSLSTRLLNMLPSTPGAHN